MDAIYPFVLFTFIGLMALLATTRSLPLDEVLWLRRICTIALLIRLVVAFVFDVVPATRLFHEDADGYEYFGMMLARSWHGDPSAILGAGATQPQNYGYTYMTASLYYVFGQFAALAPMFNCVVGTLSLVLVYRLARQFFHPLVARRATLLAAFIPSMVLWNAVAMKDSVMSFLILLALYSCIELKRRFSLWPLLGVAFSVAAMQPIRYYMVYFVAFAVLTSLFLERGIHMVSGVYKQLLLLGVVVAMLAIVGLTGRVSEGAETLTLSNLSRFRHGMAITANSGFDSDADISTPLGALGFLPIGLAELLLGPFPWQMGSLRALLAAPETIYWWILFPSLVRGVIWAVRKRFADTSPLVLFAVSMSTAYSLMHGNVGSGFRQRAQIFLILFIFASFGLYKKRAERARIDQDLLLASELRHQPMAAPATQ